MIIQVPGLVQHLQSTSPVAKGIHLKNLPEWYTGGPDWVLWWPYWSRHASLA